MALYPTLLIITNIGVFVICYAIESLVAGGEPVPGSSDHSTNEMKKIREESEAFSKTITYKILKCVGILWQIEFVGAVLWWFWEMG